MSGERCRCGHEGGEPHPCHGIVYTCRKPAKRRLYQPKLVSLAGQQMKVEAKDTWACDECWEEFRFVAGAGIQVLTKGEW